MKTIIALLPNNWGRVSAKVYSRHSVRHHLQVSLTVSKTVDAALIVLAHGEARQNMLQMKSESHLHPVNSYNSCFALEVEKPRKEHWKRFGNVHIRPRFVAGVKSKAIRDWQGQPQRTKKNQKDCREKNASIFSKISFFSKNHQPKPIQTRSDKLKRHPVLFCATLPHPKALSARQEKPPNYCP